MNRLTTLIKPKKIYMGKKDFQQFFLVRNFIEQKFNTKVIGCKTIRNKNKLALSSRNFLLNKQELNDIEKISKLFLNLKNKIKNEYLENRNTKNLTISNKYQKSKIFLSYYYKGIRLIDNF